MPLVPYKHHNEKWITTPGDYRKVMLSAISNHHEKPVQLDARHIRMPTDYSFQDIIPPPDKPEVNIAVLNAFGTGLGDTLIGLNAYKLYLQILQNKYPRTKYNFDLYKFVNPTTEIIRLYSGLYRTIRSLPTRLDALQEYDGWIDFGHFVGLKGFHEQNCFDFYLNAFSVDATEIPPEKKRLNLPLPQQTQDRARKALQRYRKPGKPICYVNPVASSFCRSLPPIWAWALCQMLSERFTVLTSVSTDWRLEHVHEVSQYTGTFVEYAALISQCDVMFSTDTLAVHLADCFSIPTVAVYPTIKSDLRSRYYPTVKSIDLPDHELSIVIKPQDTRGNRAIIENAWKKLNPEEVVKELSALPL